jgi:phosphatidylserine/phosphatidylglycerophosphate/cardiolipin synthase-like enzyme
VPVNCTAVLNRLTEGIPETSNIRVWVGAWRKGVSWNHAKLIAVDGLYLHTGGHNMWDPHYLKHNPVHDLSLELQGRVAHDGHQFANDQWAFIESMQNTCCGEMVDKMPDSLPLVAKTRVTVTEFPRGQTTEFPPSYKKRFVPKREIPADDIPIITMGRYGSMLRYYRPSDDAFVAMFDAAEKVIRLALQDLGPVRIPKTSITVPGCVWPKDYLSALGRAIYSRGVDVEIVLSNPGSIPGGLKPTEAQYGNGWSCVDVAAEIIKTIKKQFPEAADDQLRKMVEENLRVCFIRREAGNRWENGGTVGMHAKHFIVDDVCTYIGSQNLYICDLAEWGVVIDHEGQVRKIKEEYWDPMWKVSYTGEDVNVQDVMDGLDIDRDGETSMFPSEETWKQQQKAAAFQTGMLCKLEGTELYLEETDVEDEEDEIGRAVNVVLGR